MVMARSIKLVVFFSLAVFGGTSAVRAADCEDTIARHMVGEALLTANLVAFAEKAALAPVQAHSMVGAEAEAGRSRTATTARSPSILRLSN